MDHDHLPSKTNIFATGTISGMSVIYPILDADHRTKIAKLWWSVAGCRRTANTISYDVRLKKKTKQFVCNFRKICQSTDICDTYIGTANKVLIIITKKQSSCVRTEQQNNVFPTTRAICSIKYKTIKVSISFLKLIYSEAVS